MILFQNVRPFFVATPGTGLAQSTCLIANATEYVKSLVATIGIQDNTFGSISHHIQVSAHCASKNITCTKAFKDIKVQ